MSHDRILLVDDEAEFTRVLAERLTARGLRVETADSGQEALDRTKDRDFDVVVLDMAMPVMDGIETLKRLKTENPDIQVILLTGHGTVERGVEAMKVGAVDFLQKPADLEDLLAKIRDAQAKKTIIFEKRTQQKIDDILRKKGW